ncbi:MAG TPA: hypothetical protein VE890_16225 [Thermoguttaceae bacterium]|nr:hypothetical protein [Thermoguttaceae bacterium]
MESWDVVLFAVIVMVGFGFAKMGHRLCSRPFVKANKEEKNTEQGKAEDSGRDDSSLKTDRLLLGILFAGFGMVIIWMAISRYLPLAPEGSESRQTSAKADSSEVMGEVLLKVMVLRPSSTTDGTKEGVSATKPEVRVQIERLSSNNNPSGLSGSSWEWIEVARQKPLPRPTLFAGNP